MYRIDNWIAMAVVLAMAVVCVTGIVNGPVFALTAHDRAPHAEFEPALAEILGTDPLMAQWRSSSYSLRHVSIKVFDNMPLLWYLYADAVPPERLDAVLGGLLAAYAGAVPQERMDAIMAPLGYEKTQKSSSVAQGASTGQKLELKGAVMALEATERVMSSVSTGRLSIRGPVAALEKSRPAALNAQQAMRELAAAEADTLTDEVIAAEGSQLAAEAAE